MKKSLFVLMIVLLGMIILSGCSDTPTRLTIVNDTGRDLALVEWNGYYFYNGLVYDDLLHKDVNALLDGSSKTRYVVPGQGYVYFYYVGGSTEYRTDLISVASGQHTTCYITTYGATSALRGNDSITAKEAKLQKAIDSKATEQKTTN